MIQLLKLFIVSLITINTVGAQENLNDSTTMDSVYVSRVVKLINDYKACVEYSDEIEERLITAREILSRTVNERNEYKRLYNDVDNALKDMAERKEKLERKLKRTRRWGVFGSIGGFLVGVLVVVLI